MTGVPAPQPPEAGLPLASIGIPTYNRLEMLRRTVESALAQDYPRLEIIISDNASTDGTQAYCEEVSERDPRVRYVRQPRNVGAGPNFREVLDRSSGEYFMWLGDDDWIDPSYVSACAAVLSGKPDVVLACGRAEYWLGGRWLFRGVDMNLQQRAPAARVVSYYRQVGENGTFYGLFRRHALLPDLVDPRLGGDWMLVASLAAKGKIVGVDGVAVHRTFDGHSVDVPQLARRLGVPAPLARVPHVVIACSVLRDVGWAGPAYEHLPRAARLSAAVRAAASIVGRFTVRSAVTALLPGTGIVARARRLRQGWRA
jgi:hypothetical protein